MDDKLESFVTLLNKQRQVRPAAPEPARAPGWTRMFGKRADAPAAPIFAPATAKRAQETVNDSPPLATPIVPVVAAPDIVAPVEATPEIVTAAVASDESALETVEAASQAEENVAPATVELPNAALAAEASSDTPAVAEAAPLETTAAAPEEIASIASIEAVAEIAAVASEESATPAAIEMPSAALVAEASSDTPAIVEPLAETEAVAAIAPEEIAPLASVEAAPEIVAEALAEVAAPATFAAEAVPDVVETAPEIAKSVDEPIVAAPAIAETVAEPVEAVAAPEVAAAETDEPSAAPVADAAAIVDDIAAPMEAAAIAPIAAEEVTLPVDAEAAPEILEAAPDIAVVASAETVAEPVAEAVAIEEEDASPVEAAAPPVVDDIPAAPEIAAVAPQAIPETGSPLIAAIFARIAKPDQVSVAISDSAAAAISPSEAPPVAETSAFAADAALSEVAAQPTPDALRDPHDLLARFLAETDIAVTPAPEQVLAEAAAKLDEVLQAVAAEPGAKPLDDDELAAESDEDGEPTVPLPVMADAVAAARASRGYFRYGMSALAVIAGVGVVGGAYLSTQRTPTNLASGHDAAPSATMTAMNLTPAKPAVIPSPSLKATPQAASKPAVTMKADAAVAIAKKTPVAAATILATLPPPKKVRGLAIVEAKPAPSVAAKATETLAAAPPAATPLAQAPRQFAMLTPPPLDPPAPVTSSMASPPPPSPPAVAAAVPSGPQPAWERNAMPAPPYSGKPQIAIVIDDLGIDHDRTERSVGLNGAVTLSFLAYASDLPTQTQAARRAGHELIVHVPMEPVIRPKYIAQTSGGEAQAELLRRLRWDLSRFKGYVGVNNHMGSRLSADPQAMRTVIGELKARGLLFLDSRLDGNTIDVAHHEGLAAVGRDVLLDDDITAGSVGDRLAQVEKVAREHGTAIALGHPHDQTINALKLWIASLQAKGLQLVPLSAVVKDREAHVAGGGGAG